MIIKYFCEKCGKEFSTSFEATQCEYSHEEPKILSKNELVKLNIKYKEEMQKAIEQSQIDVAHGMADDVLYKLLKELGFNEIANMFNEMEKWYS